MEKSKLRVHEYMTVSPQVILSDKTVGVAQQMMSELGVRHLPVMEKGKIVGVVSGRDIRLLEYWGTVDLKKRSIREAMTPEPFTVSSQAYLKDVVNKMVEHGYGSALVEEEGKIVGIFTAVDALRLLSELMNEGEG